MMEKNKTLIIFTDSGDTIIDEASQVYDAQEPGIVSRAEFIENAGEILQQLHEEGYTLSLIHILPLLPAPGAAKTSPCPHPTC